MHLWSRLFLLLLQFHLFFPSQTITNAKEQYNKFVELENTTNKDVFSNFDYKETRLVWTHSFTATFYQIFHKSEK